MPYNGLVAHIFSKKLTPELQRMTKGERAMFLIEVATRWGYYLQKYRKVKRKRK